MQIHICDEGTYEKMLLHTFNLLFHVESPLCRLCYDYQDTLYEERILSASQSPIGRDLIPDWNCLVRTLWLFAIIVEEATL